MFSGVTLLLNAALLQSPGSGDLWCSKGTTAPEAAPGLETRLPRVPATVVPGPCAQGSRSRSGDSPAPRGSSRSWGILHCMNTRAAGGRTRREDKTEGRSSLWQAEEPAKEKPIFSVLVVEVLVTRSGNSVPKLLVVVKVLERSVGETELAVLSLKQNFK